MEYIGKKPILVLLFFKFILYIKLFKKYCNIFIFIFVLMLMQQNHIVLCSGAFNFKSIFHWNLLQLFFFFLFYKFILYRKLLKYYCKNCIIIFVPTLVQQNYIVLYLGAFNFISSFCTKTWIKHSCFFDTKTC